MAEPIEQVPKGTPLPRFWHAKHNNGIPYRPGDLDKYGKPQQEDWGTVAAKFGVDVQDLIFFNFMTNNPDEVNWYLHHYVGCVKKALVETIGCLVIVRIQELYIFLLPMT